VERFFDLATLYEKVSMDASHKLIGSLRGHEPAQQLPARKPAAAHRPMYYDDEAGRSRRGAVPTRRPGTAEPQAPARTAEPDKRQRTT
jgi:hypothetical protein